MGACAADLSTCVAQCAVIQCILRQCANNKDDHNKDDQDEDDHNKTELTPAADLKLTQSDNTIYIKSSLLVYILQ